MGLGRLVEQSSSRKTGLNTVAGLASVMLAALSCGCGKPFNVKARPAVPPAINYSASAEAEHISIRAQALTDEDFLYNTFDANVLLAGVLPVRVMLTNTSGDSADIKDARFEVRAAAGGSFKSVNEHAAFRRLISYYEIKAYNKSGYKESLEIFSEYGLDTRTPLAGGQSREGLVFFAMPTKTAQGGGLSLVVSGLRTSGQSNRDKLELKLN